MQAWELWQEGFWLWQDSLEPISSERQQSCTDKEMALVRGDPGALLIHPHSLSSLSSTLLFIPPPLNSFFLRLPNPSQIPPQYTHSLSFLCPFQHEQTHRPTQGAPPASPQTHFPPITLMQHTELPLAVHPSPATPIPAVLCPLLGLHHLWAGAQGEAALPLQQQEECLGGTVSGEDWAEWVL